MNRPIANTVLAIIGGGAILALGWMGTRRLPVFADQAKLEKSVATARAFLADASRDADRHFLVLEELEALAAATLGGDLETVDHALRTRLNRIGEAVGLAELSVGTTGAAPKGTPATVQLRGRNERALRDEVDFVEVGAVVRGHGTLAQTLELLERVEAEPWHKRIDALRLDPRDNGSRIDLTLRLTTIFLPGAEPATPAPGTPDPAALAAAAELAEANPFRIPPPPKPVVIAASEPDPPAAPAFQPKHWTISGVVLGPDGTEVWLRNRESGETRTLGVGDAIDRFRVAAAEGETVELAVGESRFRLTVGQHLGQRAKVP